MPHLHLSLQAGDDMILKRMKRRHQRADAVAFAARARGCGPDIAFGADLIAGFPTEDRGDVRATRWRCRRSAASTYLHVFPYRPRPARRPRACRSCAARWCKERAARLRAAGERGARRALSTAGSARPRRRWSSARSPASAAPSITPPVRFDGATAPTGERRAACASPARDSRDAVAATARMTDPSDRARGWFAPARRGPQRARRSASSDGITGVFTKRQLDEAALERARGAADRGRPRPRPPRRRSPSGWQAHALRPGGQPTSEVAQALAEASPTRCAGRQAARRSMPAHKPFVVLVVGVNGSGKTTTIGKLAQSSRRGGPERHARRRRHLPRRRGRAAEDLGRARRRAGDVAGRRAPTPPASPIDALQPGQGRRRRRAADRHRRPAAEQAGADGRAGEDRARAEASSTRPRRTRCCWCSTPPSGQNAPAQVETFRQHRRRHRPGHDQARRHRQRRRAGGARRALRPADQAIGVGEGIDDLQPFDAEAFARALLGPREPA